MGKNFDLEHRLITFSINILEIADKLPNSKSGVYISSQIIRSGTSPAMNFDEAESADSKNEYIQIMKLCLKELRETLVSLKIIYRKPLIEDSRMVEDVMNECIELIAVFIRNIDITKKNLTSKRKKNND